MFEGLGFGVQGFGFLGLCFRVADHPKAKMPSLGSGENLVIHRCHQEAKVESAALVCAERVWELTSSANASALL